MPRGTFRAPTSHHGPAAFLLHSTPAVDLLKKPIVATCLLVLQDLHTLFVSAGEWHSV